MKKILSKSQSFARLPKIALILAILQGCGQRQAESQIASSLDAAKATTTEVVSLTAIADAHVHSKKVTENFGSKKELIVNSDPAVLSYIKFKAARIKGEIIGAKIQMYSLKKSSDGPALYITKNNWQEASITYKNRPKLGNLVADAESIAAKSVVEYDVSQQIKKTGTYSFVLAEGAKAGIQFSSKESARPPTLLLTVKKDGNDAPVEEEPAEEEPVAEEPTEEEPNVEEPVDDIPPPPVTGKVKAFPTAEGFGSETAGGRGGRVIQVTTLADSGAGSLRECLLAKGPRICVFTVSGIINLKSTIEIVEPFLTVAGQTAPGAGITVKTDDSVRFAADGKTYRDNDVHIKIKTHDIVIRYLKLRPGSKGSNARALSINAGSGDKAYNIVIDHNSLSWSGDEILIAWDDTQKVTYSWNNLSESMSNELIGSTGLKGPNLGKEAGGFYSLHHNIIAHHTQRLPNISTGTGPTNVVNNVMYNAGGIGTRILLNAQTNFLGNYIKSGPNTRINEWFKDDGAGGFFLGGSNTNASNSNLIDTSVTGKAIKLLASSSESKIKKNRIIMSGIDEIVTVSPAADAFDQVLNGAGAIYGLNCDGTPFKRVDAVDARIIASIRAGTKGHNSSQDYIFGPEDVGGYPAHPSAPACADSDRDGMPDAFEDLKGFNKNVNDSAGDKDGNGYTNIEEFLNRI